MHLRFRNSLLAMAPSQVLAKSEVFQYLSESDQRTARDKKKKTWPPDWGNDNLTIIVLVNGGKSSITAFFAGQIVRVNIFFLYY